jgi:hypothetical protein
MTLTIMASGTNDLKQVWVFNDARNHFPSAVFTERRLAEAWIQKNQLEGTLTAYPLNISAYDWAIEKGYFTPKTEEEASPNFIANFSSGSQEHYHFENEEDSSPITEH